MPTSTCSANVSSSRTDLHHAYEDCGGVVVALYGFAEERLYRSGRVADPAECLSHVLVTDLVADSISTQQESVTRAKAHVEHIGLRRSRVSGVAVSRRR